MDNKKELVFVAEMTTMICGLVVTNYIACKHWYKEYKLRKELEEQLSEYEELA